MDRTKVQGGTPTGRDSKCDTCSYAVVVQGYAESERVTACSKLQPYLLIRFPVAECTMYYDRRVPPLWELEEIALDLTKERSARAGIRAGAVKADEVAALVAVCESEVKES